ncbi:hypothetical protein CKM354_001221700 [Cercospora kikuchii]|uniref:Uncharacterized protein n=1 Tax=Cercospora kikuchii TaxID=84275 RepID=A0A9P3L2D7_9PEZI|nr:uncharacterized protein CKM354_001221700 [Cercospora kikuchii]GIZ49182.1 hypothetical protein CKM354_001221700 [Cercospora kikuchii]
MHVFELFTTSRSATLSRDYSASCFWDATVRSIIDLGQRHKENFNATAATEEITELLHRHGIELQKLPEVALQYVKNNPGKTAIDLVTLLMMLYPGLVWAPVWRALGLTPIGFVAGGIFASLQRTIGTPLAMRVAQGAAMGGRAQTVLNGVVQGAAVLKARFADVFKAANETGGTQ